MNKGKTDLFTLKPRGSLSCAIPFPPNNMVLSHLPTAGLA